MKYNFAKNELKITAGMLSQFPKDGKPQIALSGRSNVGKSSLINMLTGRKKLARVSSTPGKTITVNFYEIDNSFYLVDLPGYGFARRNPEEKAKWSALTDGYFTKYAGHTLTVIQLIDLKVGCTSDDLMMIDYMKRSGISFAVVATKADKLNTTERNKAVERLQSEELLRGARIIVSSSVKDEGKDKIMGVISDAVSGENQ